MDSQKNVHSKRSLPYSFCWLWQGIKSWYCNTHMAVRGGTVGKMSSGMKWATGGLPGVGWALWGRPYICVHWPSHSSSHSIVKINITTVVVCLFVRGRVLRIIPWYRGAKDGELKWHSAGVKMRYLFYHKDCHGSNDMHVGFNIAQKICVNLHIWTMTRKKHYDLRRWEVWASSKEFLQSYPLYKLFTNIIIIQNGT